MNATLARITHLTAEAPTAGDGPLLDAFLAGDQSAFAVLVRRHAGLVFAACRRVLRHHQDAEDAFQATFLVLARRAADVWPREAVGSWLFGVAHRVALKARAVRSRRTVREQPLEEVPGPDRPAPEFDLAEAVHRVVCRLPEVYRAAVVACDLEGLSRKEAAERLGWTEGTLSGRLARARDLLARRFRRIGLTLPAGGLATVCGGPESVSAAVVQAAIDLATGTAAAGASAPVAALTEGVVRSMAIFKFKSLAAAVFAALAIGFGVFAAAAGAGGTGGTGEAPDGEQPGVKGGASTPKAPKPADPPARILTEKPAGKPVTDRDRLQGTWRVVSLAEGGKTVPTNPKDPWVIEVSGSTLRMPFLEGGGASGSSGSTGGSGSSSTSGATSGFGWKQREYTFALEETKTPRTIDLVAKQKPVGRGIYEFTLPSAQCATCHNHPFVEKGAKPPADEMLPPCEPARKDAQRMREAGVRLALSITDKRPEKFGGDGVIVFELKREDVLTVAEMIGGPRIEMAQHELELLRRELEVAAVAGKLDAAALERLRTRIRATEALLAAGQKPPAATEAQRLAIRIAIAKLREAQADLERAEAEVDLARAEAQRAQNQVDLAFKKLEAAKERVKAAEKAFRDAGANPQPAPAAKGGGEFTVHVRPLADAEKVIRVKVTGNQTVLEGLAYATEVVPVKSDGVSVWVVRDKAVLPVDLPAITRNADAKTNYTLKAGDQLFIQVKAEK